MIDITTKQFTHCDLVEISGRVNSQTSVQLAEALAAILDQDRFKIVLDMNKVDFVSSAGLRVIIDVQKTCKRWNRGEMVLTGVQPRIYDTLDLTGFVPLFKMFDSVVDAVGYF